MDDEEIEYAQEHDPRWGLVGGWANQVEDTVERVEDMYERDPQLVEDSLAQGITPGEMPQEYFDPQVETYGNEEHVQQPSYGDQTYGEQGGGETEQPAWEGPAVEHEGPWDAPPQYDGFGGDQY